MFSHRGAAERESIIDIINYLIGINYLVPITQREKYLLARRYEPELTSFFQSINWEFRCDSQNEVAYVVSPDSTHRRNMDKEETIWLLVLRLLYEEKRGELSFAGCPITTMAEIRTKYDLAGFRFFDGKNKVRIKKLIEFTKRYNLADALDEDIYAEDCRFRLFHSLLYAITADQAEKLHREIQERIIKKEGDAHEIDDETALD